MEKYFAEIENGVVKRVIVAETLEWCTQNLGGEWVSMSKREEAGIGYKYDKEKGFLVPLENERQVVSGNIFIRKNHLAKKGDVVPAHLHNFDHTTIFFQGSFKVTEKNVDGKEETVSVTAPTHMLIKATSLHEIEALEDDSIFWCVFSHRNEHGEVQQEAANAFEPYI